MKAREGSRRFSDSKKRLAPGGSLRKLSWRRAVVQQKITRWKVSQQKTRMTDKMKLLRRRTKICYISIIKKFDQHIWEQKSQYIWWQLFQWTNWPLKWTKVKCKYSNRKPICNFIFNYNTKVWFKLFPFSEIFPISFSFIINRFIIFSLTNYFHFSFS